SVYVQRNDADYKLEADVLAPSLQLRGTPGSRARVIVVAFNASKSEYGPSSPSSVTFTFPPSGATAASANAGIAVSPISFARDGAGDGLVANAGAVRARLTAAGGAAMIAELGTSAGATLAGIADFDANGSDDVAWRAASGGLVLWLMSGGAPIATVELALAPGVDVLGAGDFDGDGAAEVAVRGVDGAAYLIHPLAAL